MLNSKLRILILLAALLAPTTTQAQGLIAYPFLECPKVQVDPKLDAEQLCVWVTYASVNNIRGSEYIEGNFEIQGLNPGSSTPVVETFHFDHSGMFVRMDSTGISPGETRQLTLPGHAPADRLRGIFIVTSSAPLLLWARNWQTHHASGDGLNRVPRAASLHNVPIYPVDCSANTTKTFQWVCNNLRLEGPI